MGFLEQFNRKRISGWVKSENSNEFPMVNIAFNGEAYITIEANIERADLKGIGYGFKLDFPSNLRDNKKCTVEVTTSSGDHIKNSPANVVVSPNEYDKVLRGKDGWLFLTGDSNDTLAQSTGEVEYSEENIVKWRNLLRKRKYHFDSLGIEYFHMIAPSKECVLSAYLPDELSISEYRPVKRILSFLEKDIRELCIYPDYSCDPLLEKTYHKGIPTGLTTEHTRHMLLF